MQKDRDTQARDFVQKLQYYNSQIKLLENDSLSENDQVELLKLKTERHQLTISETQEAIETKEEWLTNPKLVAAKNKAESGDNFASTRDEEMEH